MTKRILAGFLGPGLLLASLRDSPKQRTGHRGRTGERGQQIDGIHRACHRGPRQTGERRSPIHGDRDLVGVAARGHSRRPIST